MAKRTRFFKLAPFVSTLNTSVDPAFLQPNEAVQLDDVLISYTKTMPRRDGINYNYDNKSWATISYHASSGQMVIVGTFLNTCIEAGDWISINSISYPILNNSFNVISIASNALVLATGSTYALTSDPTITQANQVVGGFDYWRDNSGSKQQNIVTVLDNGTIIATSGTTRTRLQVADSVIQAPLTAANFEVYNNNLILTFSGLTNTMKYWTGDPAVAVQDVPANIYINVGGTIQEAQSFQRSSSGNTRTVAFNGNFNSSTGAVVVTNLQVGSTIIIHGSTNPAYNGRFIVASIGASSVPFISNQITYSAPTVLSEGVTADTGMTVGHLGPPASLVRNYQGVLWCNDKSLLDRLYFNGADLFSWVSSNGASNDALSGGLDVGFGDGDPSGITALSPIFQGVMFVGKTTRIYRVTMPDTNPDNATLSLVSDGIGVASQQGMVAVEQDELYFVSLKGVHAMTTTNAFGDFLSSYVSAPVQATFTASLNRAAFQQIKASYLPDYNTILLSTRRGTGKYNDTLYCYNVAYKSWFRWPDVPSNTLIQAQDTDRKRVYLGGASGRIAQTLTGLTHDIQETGGQNTIVSQIMTGFIAPDGNLETIKGFKALYLYLREQGTFVITGTVQIDNFDPQPFTVNNNSLAPELGNFTLGFDVLGQSTQTAPYAIPIDGYGRSIQITLNQNDQATSLSIQGIGIEYTDLEGVKAEVRGNSGD